MNEEKLKEKRVLYILLGTLIILFLLLLSLLSRRQKLDQRLLEQAQQQNTTDTSAGKAPLTLPLPNTAFSGYTLNAELPSLPESVKLSDLKTSFTTGEALDLATKIGFDNSIVDDGASMILVTDQSGDQQSLLTVSKTTGGFLVVSEIGYPSGVSGADITAAARSFLTKMGIMDDTLDAYATYKRESSPGVTFVEFHRNWEKLGLPILNPVGVLNLDQTERLADVRLGYIENAAPDDPDVIESSDGNAGKVRPNQFNTVTVGVLDENNNIMSVASNVKLFNRTQQKSSTQTLKTPEEALEELKSGKTSFSLVKPTGEGVVNLNTTFPNSQAVAENAVINEVVLTYLDEVGQKTQSTLYPHYLFRGTTTLASGYETQFVETVPAVKQINTLGVFAQNSQPTVFPGQGSTLQYGTFNWLSPGPNPNQNLACAGLTQIFQLPNGGYIGWYPNVAPRNWYYVPPPGEVIDAAKMQEVKKILRWEAAKACKGSLNDPSICAYSDTGVNLQTACYYAGSGSPFMYFYTPEAKQLEVRLAKNAVTYADPPLSREGLWNFTTSPDGTLKLTNGLEKERLYYEFNKDVLKSSLASLKNNKQGFAVERSKLGELTYSLALKLGLNSSEKESLLVELTREANQLSSRTLKVGLLDRQLVDKLLPVSVTPLPDNYHRVLFYVTSGNVKEKLQTPSLQKLIREGDTVVEVGAVSF
ncbi:hypothetical protein HY612_04475 [Candidatus Roizmanbacteria bacterium]|nr:hypothetical protein [Candidatus Roizmanbacteria bacterium]